MQSTLSSGDGMKRVYIPAGMSADVGVVQTRGLCSEIFRLYFQFPREGECACVLH